MIAALLLALSLTAPEGDEAAQRLTEANQRFNNAKSEGDLRRAAELYRTLIEGGIQNGPLHYNLGLTHLRLKEVGPAILHFRRSLLYSPLDPYALKALESARRQVQDQLEAPAGASALKALLFWHHETSSAARLWALIVSSAAFWTVLALRSTTVPFRRSLLGVSGAASLLLAGSLLAASLSGPGEAAVVVLPEVDVRRGNGPSHEPVFSAPIRQGVEVTILESRGNWQRLEFPNGVQGWTLASGVAAVLPPPTLHR